MSNFPGPEEQTCSDTNMRNTEGVVQPIVGYEGSGRNKVLLDIPPTPGYAPSQLTNL